jgi:hypothetical protein
VEQDNELPDVSYGEAGAEGSDALTPKVDAEFDVDDDELLAETPADVVEMLGFDPKNETSATEEEDSSDAAE